MRKMFKFNYFPEERPEAEEPEYRHGPEGFGPRFGRGPHGRPPMGPRPLPFDPDSLEGMVIGIARMIRHSGRERFGSTQDRIIRILDENSNQEILHYDLGEDFSIEPAVVVGELYRHGAEWKFNAIGSGYQGGLAALVNDFGLA